MLPEGLQIAATEVILLNLVMLSLGNGSVVASVILVMGTFGVTEVFLEMAKIIHLVEETHVSPFYCHFPVSADCTTDHAFGK